MIFKLEFERLLYLFYIFLKCSGFHKDSILFDDLFIIIKLYNDGLIEFVFFINLRGLLPGISLIFYSIKMLNNNFNFIQYRIIYLFYLFLLNLFIIFYSLKKLKLFNFKNCIKIKDSQFLKITKFI